MILDLAYGYTAESDANDPLVDLIETALEQISVASQPGAWAVDFFPWRKSLAYQKQFFLTYHQSDLCRIGSLAPPGSGQEKSSLQQRTRPQRDLSSSLR